jgi:SEC-C motif domain protein
MNRCPCGLGLPYEECCEPAHRGRPPVTAEALMRSRYSAYALNDVGYLLRSWHPATRPDTLEPGPDLRWTGLEIVATAAGGMFDAEGEVEFAARYAVTGASSSGRRGEPGPHAAGGERGELRERSRFVRHDGVWVYLGPITPDTGVRAGSPSRPHRRPRRPA